MLSCLLEMKLAVIAVLESDIDHKHLNLSSKDWDLAKALANVLDPFQKATTLLGGESYATTSLVLPIIASIRQDLVVATGHLKTIKKFNRSLSEWLTKKMPGSRGRQNKDGHTPNVFFRKR